MECCDNRNIFLIDHYICVSRGIIYGYIHKISCYENENNLNKNFISKLFYKRMNYLDINYIGLLIEIL